MGYTAYNSDSRSVRSAMLGYETKGIGAIFSQQRERRIHESMNPKGAEIRESRDSDAHPNTVPIILALDVTGSMGHIPHDLIKNGLPTLMGGLIQKGVSDASLLFLACGDHECDSYPLQIGQFESGDEELDMWLTRTYLEGGGGGNRGESYLLAWYFAAMHTSIDSYEKRKKKGFLFTVGDEPNLQNLPQSAVKEIMGNAAKGQGNFSAEELLTLAKEKYEVFHLCVNHSFQARESLAGWKAALGQRCIEVADYQELPKVIINTVLSNVEQRDSVSTPESVKSEKFSPAEKEKVEIL